MSFLQSLSMPLGARAEPEAPTREPPRVDEAHRRRVLVNMVVAEALAKLSIPSDWVRCTTLEAVSRSGRPRTVVQLAVLKGDDQLLPMIPRLQESIDRELRRRDPRRADWLGTICWEFRGQRDARFAAMPDASYWH
ncbi:MAG: hypothetical protein HY854_11880 [Burkholderiales bacterium]|nr:hypothetical protein [Burkholderiales bacterium]